MSTVLELDRTVSVTAPATSHQRRFRHVAPLPSGAGEAEPFTAGDVPVDVPFPGPQVIDFEARLRAAHELVDPRPLLVNLARCVTEIIAGVRSLDQLARWVTDDVYLTLLRRVTIAARSRAITGGEARRPRLSIGDPIVTGLALSDTRMILSGAIPAAVLALAVDALLGAGQRVAAKRWNAA